MEGMPGKFSVPPGRSLPLSLMAYSPGRFFVQVELKMIIAYLLLNYDVQPLAQRPPNRWIGSAVVPPDKETIWIKRKIPSS
jgi:hypothetical protein